MHGGGCKLQRQLLTPAGVQWNTSNSTPRGVQVFRLAYHQGSLVKENSGNPRENGGNPRKSCESRRENGGT